MPAELSKRDKLGEDLGSGTVGTSWHFIPPALADRAKEIRNASFAALARS